MCLEKSVEEGNKKTFTSGLEKKVELSSHQRFTRARAGRLDVFMQAAILLFFPRLHSLCNLAALIIKPG